MKGKIANFLKHNWMLISTSAVFLFLSVWYWGHTINILIDVGREFYYPQMMMQGAVLYKDLFCQYTPLSYFVNMWLFRIFGVSFNTLFAAAHVNTVIILVLTYLISRFFNKPAFSYLVVLFVMLRCAFLINNSFNMPYAFAIIYSLSAVMAGLYFLLKFAKVPKKRYLLAASFFTGAAVSFKIDALPFAAAIVAVMYFFKQFNFKTVPTFLFGAAIVPCMSFGLVLLSGADIPSLQHNLSIVQDIMLTDGFRQLYTNYSGMTMTLAKATESLLWFLPMAVMLVILGAWVYYPVKYIKLKKRSKVSVVAILCSVIWVIFVDRFYMFTEEQSLCWLPVAAIALVVFQTVSIFKRHKAGECVFGAGCRDEKFTLMYILGVSSLLVGNKSLFWIYMYSLGTISFPLYFIYVITMLYNYVPVYIKAVDAKMWERTFKIVLGFMLLVQAHYCAGQIGQWCDARIDTPQGTVYINEHDAKVLGPVIDYIQKNTPQDAYVLMLHEGVTVNFMTGRKTHKIYHNLPSVMIELFGEDKIVLDFIANPPDYIFITSHESSEYNQTKFGESYAKNIMTFIERNYKKARRFQGVSKHCEDDLYYIDMYQRGR